MLRNEPMAFATKAALGEARKEIKIATPAGKTGFCQEVNIKTGAAGASRSRQNQYDNIVYRETQTNGNSRDVTEGHLINWLDVLNKGLV